MQIKRVPKTGVVILFLIFILTVAYSVGLRINITDSLPPGLWLLQNNKTLLTGQAVLICPPQNEVFQLAHERGYIFDGTCESGYAPLIKPIAAVSGDIVEINAAGVYVNGKLIENSQPFSHDGLGREMPGVNFGRYEILDGELWLISNYNHASFDSRYFGALPLENVKGVMKPLIVAGDWNGY